MAADSMPFGRVGIGCDSLSSAALQIKSQEPSLLGKASPCFITARQILSRSVFHSASTTHPLRSCSVSAAFPTPLPRARSPARLFLTCTPFVPHYGTPVTDSPRGIPIGMFMSGHAIRGCGQFLRGRRHCPHSGRASLQRTESALLRSLPRSHRSLPVDSSCVADCLQSPLPDPLQTAPPPLRNSPCPGGRTLTRQPEWHTASTRLSVQAAESPLYPARTSSRPPPAAAYGLACSHLTRLCPLRSQRLARCRARPH